MATTVGSSSSPHHDLPKPPTAVVTMAAAPTTNLDSSLNLPMAVPLALPAPPPFGQQSASPSTATANPRRLPPPCWSHDETVALIDAYRDKWYSLRRGNLKANHWLEVAEAVGQSCPAVTPAKTPVQCRHKMEKLRKRYRTEIQRARSMPMSRFSSSWVHFKRMDSMEKGPTAAKTPDNNINISDFSGGIDNNNDDEEEDDEEDDQDYGGSGGGGDNVSGGGYRIRIPSGVSIAQPGPKIYPKFGDQKYNTPQNPNFMVNSTPNTKPNNNINMGSAGIYGNNRVYDSGKSVSGPASVKREREPMAGFVKREREPMAEMVAAIKMLGDGFVRMEQMKMEMAREVETMRVEMEMKRTEMILESQHRIVEAFAKAVSERKAAKKQKRKPSPA
ncbi:hypothetical protein ACFE04_018619 [Oxalis oulophora]